MNPYVRIALPAVQEFADAAGLRARLLERFGEYLEMRWEESSLSKVVKVLPTSEEFKLRVEATARESLNGKEVFGRGAKWCWRAVGYVNLCDRAKDKTLKLLLAEALSYLRSLRPEDVEEEYLGTLGHWEQQILPIVDDYAAAHDGSAETDHLALTFQVVVTWPRSDPHYRLTAYAGPRSGISVTYEVRSHKRRGMLRRREWRGPGFREVSPGIYEDAAPALLVDDWTDLAGLKGLLTQAAERAQKLLRKQEGR